MLSFINIGTSTDVCLALMENCLSVTPSAIKQYVMLQIAKKTDEDKLQPTNLPEGFCESASLPLPDTAQTEGSGVRDANEQFDRMPFLLRRA